MLNQSHEAEIRLPNLCITYIIFPLHVMKNLFVCCFFLLSKTRKENYYPDILQTTCMMKGTGKKLSDQTTWYEPRKNVKNTGATQLWLTEDISLVGFCCFECSYFWQSFLWILFPQVLFLTFLFSPRCLIKKQNPKKQTAYILKHFLSSLQGKLNTGFIYSYI